MNIGDPDWADDVVKRIQRRYNPDRLTLTASWVGIVMFVVFIVAIIGAIISMALIAIWDIDCVLQLIISAVLIIVSYIAIRICGAIIER